MKITLTFLLMSMMVFVSHQHKFPLQQFANILPPWSYRQQPNLQDFYEYLFARSLLQSINPLAAPHPNSGLRMNHGGFAPEPDVNQWPDAQSRNSPLTPEIESSVAAVDDIQANPRVFLNYVTTAGSNSYFNPFLKTVYYITSLTATSTVIKSCIQAASFAAGSSTITCRKRRDVMSVVYDLNRPVMQDFDDSLGPSQVLPVEASAFARALSVNGESVMTPIELASSKSDGYDGDAAIARDKRYLLAASTTITSYVFVTTTSTKTLSSLGSGLSCLPSLFALC